MFSHWRYRRRCQILARNCNRQNLSAYISGSAAIAVDELGNTPLISVDLEMTGLDARQNQIIAIGWTLLDNGRISLA